MSCRLLTWRLGGKLVPPVLGRSPNRFEFSARGVTVRVLAGIPRSIATANGSSVQESARGLRPFRRPPACSHEASKKHSLKTSHGAPSGDVPDASRRRVGGGLAALGCTSAPASLWNPRFYQIVVVICKMVNCPLEACGPGGTCNLPPVSGL